MLEKSSAVTPLMQQYFDIKNRYKDCLIFFQVGDFYELFFEDAKQASSFLGITLTKRGTLNGEPIPLAGVPVHNLDHHLSKLVKGGFKVVICDQLEEAQQGKVVRRGVRQVLTPGTLTDSKLLDSKSASYILFLSKHADTWGLVFVELLTGQMFATVVSDEKNLETELIRFFPDEIVLENQDKSIASFLKTRGYVVTIFDEFYDKNEASKWLNTLEKSDILLVYESLFNASILMYSYLKKNQEESLSNIESVHAYKSDDFLVLDSSTQKNLELVYNIHDRSTRNTLFSVLDLAVTSMGSRMIKKWLQRPLIKVESINSRLDAVELFVKDILLKDKLIIALKDIGDIERIVGRVALGRATQQDYLNLKNALSVFPVIDSLLTSAQNKILLTIASKIKNFSRLHTLLERSINDDLSQSYLIKLKFDNRLDEIRELVNNGHQKILEFENREIESSGISSLKVRFNDVIGYYIEVTKTNMDFVPEHYKRIQTLSNRERYITAELKELQLKIDSAKREISSIENELYLRIKLEVFSQVNILKKAAYALANLDALIGFADAAYQNGYVRPTFNNEFIDVQDGRHPVVEKTIEKFIPNSTFLNFENRVWIITGPNMGGKSTYLRQVALLSIMGQCGSFVPAKSANLKILDKIFTRIGAGDNLAEGKSTFLVEMEETATICKSATKNSLVILDEVGRGTSTYDGFAIAQSVVEYINKKIGALCLFATHYHELTSLENNLSGIVCYAATIKKSGDSIIFMHKIERGVAQSSFGLEVAKLADLPSEIIDRASFILNSINNKLQ